MLTLYHADTAVCAAKVRLALAEKQLPWEGHLLVLARGDQFDPAYLKLNPNAVVPTLIHDGLVVTESTVINEYLEDAFPEHPLRPESAYERARMRLWTKREDTIHDAVNTMTATLIFRPALLAKPPEERAKRYEKMPDPARRDKWRIMLEEGLDAAYVREALTRFARLFRDMEAALAKGPWLLGEHFTLADVGFISFLFRMEMMQTSGIWQAHFPGVTDWFERCKARPTFDPAIRNPIDPAAFGQYEKTAGPERERVLRIFRTALAGL
jgi:glutathione S-transferase